MLRRFQRGPQRAVFSAAACLSTQHPATVGRINTATNHIHQPAATNGTGLRLCFLQHALQVPWTQACRFFTTAQTANGATQVACKLHAEELRWTLNRYNETKKTEETEEAKKIYDEHFDGSEDAPRCKCGKLIEHHPKLIIEGTGSNPPNSGVASPSINSFLVNPQRMIQHFKAALGSYSHVYLKGGVHESKTSFAQTYAEKFPSKACVIKCNVATENSQCEVLDRMSFANRIVDQYNSHVKRNCREGDLPEYLEWNKRLPLLKMKYFTDLGKLPSDFMVFFDECHIMFDVIARDASDSDGSFCGFFFKNPGLRCVCVYLSTTQAGLVLLAEYPDMIVLPWRFTKEEVRALTPCMLDGKITERECPEDVADILFGLFCGHRGMTVMALEYLAVYLRQNKLELNFGNVRRCLHHMLSETALSVEGDKLVEGALASRAVRISGDKTKKFPDDFGENIVALMKYALATGEIPYDIACATSSYIRQGVKHGVLIPVQLRNEPAKAAPLVEVQPYCIANPFVARWLADQIPRPWDFVTLDKPALAVDAVVSAFANIDYRTFFSEPQPHVTTETPGEVWFEHPITSALCQAMHWVYKDKRTTSPPFKQSGDSTQGETPDIVGYDGRLTIENVVFDRNKKDAILERYGRFGKKKTALEKGNSGLLVVCCAPNEVKDVEKLVREKAFSDKNKAIRENIPVLIVEIDRKSLWKFNMTLLEHGKAPVKATIRTDLGVWKFNAEKREFRRATILTEDFENKVEEPLAPHTSFRVSVTGPGIDEPIVANVAATLRKGGRQKTVEGLIYAVRNHERIATELKKVDFSKTLGVGLGKVNLLKLTVYPPAATKEEAMKLGAFGQTPEDEKKPCPGGFSSPLKEARRAIPYHIIVE